MFILGVGIKRHIITFANKKSYLAAEWKVQVMCGESR